MGISKISAEKNFKVGISGYGFLPIGECAHMNS